MADTQPTTQPEPVGERIIADEITADGTRVKVVLVTQEEL
jgi:hypothetical protein